MRNIEIYDHKISAPAGITDLPDAVNLSDPVTLKQLTSGTYTPTAPITTNASGVTTYKCHYTKVLNEVTVTGKILYTNVSGIAVSQVNLTLPIPSNLATADDLVGTGVTGATPTTFCIITGDVANNQATLLLGVTNAGDVWASTFTFTYTVLS